MSTTTPRSNLTLYRHLIQARIRSQLQYRTSLLIDSIGAFCLTFIDFLVILALFRHFPRLGGWSVREVAFLYGIAGLGFSVCDMIVGHIEGLGDMIRSGQFDAILIRPAGTLLQVVGADFALRRFGKALQSMIVLIYAIATLHLQWNAFKVVLTILSVASGAAIFGAVFILTACTQFVVLGSGEVANAFTYGGNQFTSYPLSIYSKWLRRIFAYVIPLGFVAYFPAEYILGRSDDAQWVQLVGPGVAAAFLALSVGVWTFAVRSYRSTGS